MAEAANPPQPRDQGLFSEATFVPAETTSPAFAGLLWFAAIFAVLVQEGAFIASPAISKLVTDAGSTDVQTNVFNTIAVTLNIIFALLACSFDYRKTIFVIHNNKSATALLIIIVLSALWSIHPDITARRSVNYLSTVLTACFLATEFSFDQFMRIASRATAISVFGSFAFVALFPTDAIHQVSPYAVEIAGSWRGAFAHKNALGMVAALGVLVELYMLVATSRAKTWHLLLLVGSASLVFFSRSSTAAVVTLLYVMGGGLLFLLLHARQYFGVGVAAVCVLLTTGILIYIEDPTTPLAVLGKDSTLTGRTELWGLVLNLIYERPLLGWGYSALWLPNEPVALAISQYLGWTVPNSHNAILEVTLDLGLVGLTTVVAFVAIAFMRSVRCLMAGEHGMGMVLLFFLIGLAFTGATEATWARSQSPEWLVLNVLSFNCGLMLWRQERRSTSLMSAGPVLRV